MKSYERSQKNLQEKASIVEMIRNYIRLNIQSNGKNLEDKDQYIKLILTSILKGYKESKFPLLLKNMIK